MSTDISLHHSLVNQFSNTPLEEFQENDLIQSGIIMHASDLSNVLLDFDNYLLWTSLLSQEFNYQTCREAKMGVPITDMFVYKGFDNFVKG